MLSLHVTHGQLCTPTLQAGWPLGPWARPVPFKKQRKQMAPAIIQTLPRSHTSCWSFMTGRADAGTISARSVTVPLKPNFIRVAYVFHTMAKTIDRRIRSCCASPGSISGQCMWDLWWTKWQWYRFFSAYVGFALPIPSQQRSMIIFIYMLFLPEGQTGEAWEPTVPFRKSENTGQKKYVHLRCWCGLCLLHRLLGVYSDQGTIWLRPMSILRYRIGENLRNK